MGAPVALASDPLKRSSFLQILYLRIKHRLTNYTVWLIDAAITHLPHTKNCFGFQFPAVICEISTFPMLTYDDGPPTKIFGCA